MRAQTTTHENTISTENMSKCILFRTYLVLTAKAQTTAALGESVLSGAYERWGEQAALGKTELLEILAKAEAQVSIDQVPGAF